MSTNLRCGDKLGFESARAFARFRERAYSNDERTPCRKVMLIVASGFPPSGRSARYRGRNGWSLGKACSTASTRPGAETDPVTNATPTGSNDLGGRCLAE